MMQAFAVRCCPFWLTNRSVHDLSRVSCMVVLILARVQPISVLRVAAMQDVPRLVTQAPTDVAAVLLADILVYVARDVGKVAASCVLTRPRSELPAVFFQLVLQLTNLVSDLVKAPCGLVAALGRRGSCHNFTEHTARGAEHCLCQ
jgi:hypothetical protein